MCEERLHEKGRKGRRDEMDEGWLKQATVGIEKGKDER